MVHINGQEFGLNYQPAEENTLLFGSNSNWQESVWLPMIYLLVQADELSKRLVSPFRKDKNGHRPANDYSTTYRDDPYFSDLVLFYEYYHGDSARGVGAF